MCNSRDHLGIRFEVWTSEWSWFWRAFNSHNSGGAVGAAATQADAVREACVAIEEMSAQDAESAPSLPLATGRGFAPVIAREVRSEIWTTGLERLAEYVATI
jgi:hypothetical protein